jgi:putative tryptophan/tyrosine transport system substrate-binding protein
MGRCEETAMKLRTVAFLVTLVLGILSTLLAADAQEPAKVVRIGILCGESCDTCPYKAFRQRLRELGYPEGQNTAIEERAAEGRVERLSELAAELLGLRVDIILTAGGTESALAAKGATRTLPVVFVIAADPVSMGLVASFARPGGNITGLASMNAELDAKRLELLKEAVPGITRVAVLSNPVDPGAESAWTAQEAAARALEVQLQRLEVRGPNDFERAFGAAATGGAEALTVLASPRLFGTGSIYLPRIAAFAAKTRLPAISHAREFPEAGGLMSYGVSIPDLFRRAADHVDKILKGAKPADLPVEQPLKFELVINLKTAKALGLAIPPSLLFRADEVIR